MKAIRYAERDPDGNLTGREVVVQGRELAPLGFADLVDRPLGASHPIRLCLRGAEVVESSMEEFPKGNASWIDTTVDTHLTSQHVGLVRGGWLPAGLALEAGSVIMIDRCTLSDFKGRFSMERRDTIGQDFVDWLNHPDARLNPALLALEGNQREFPTRDDIEAQMRAHIAHLRNLLPKATVIGDAPDVMEAIIRLAEQQQAASERVIQFLLATAPVLRHPVSRDRLPFVAQEIANTARRAGLPLTEMVVLCAISAAAISRGRNSAKRALKFTKQNYNRQDAFNAMSDLRSLKAFASLLGLVPDLRPMLCTSDKDLALVWCGLNISSFDTGDGPPTVKARPIEAFLPRAAGLIYKQLLEESAG